MTVPFGPHSPLLPTPNPGRKQAQAGRLRSQPEGRGSGCRRGAVGWGRGDGTPARPHWGLLPPAGGVGQGRRRGEPEGRRGETQSRRGGDQRQPSREEGHQERPDRAGAGPESGAPQERSKRQPQAERGAPEAGEPRPAGREGLEGPGRSEEREGRGPGAGRLCTPAAGFATHRPPARGGRGPATRPGVGR